MLKLLKECKKYSVNTYRNTLDFMCDLELFSKIRSQIAFFLLKYVVYSLYIKNNTLLPPCNPVGYSVADLHTRIIDSSYSMPEN